AMSSRTGYTEWLLTEVLPRLRATHAGAAWVVVVGALRHFDQGMMARALPADQCFRQTSNSRSDHEQAR
ncbi:MAG TPA: hypothetical protein VKZ99_03615, partial [Gammaproteobacteria bacterium]|nr:hypothetical protein [Gammaproteobacteria bacterium]